MMKVKTRKKWALWLIGMGYFFIPWFGIFFMGNRVIDTLMKYLIMNALLSLLSVVFIWGGVAVLKKLLNAVTRLFFKRYLIAMSLPVLSALTRCLCFLLPEELRRETMLVVSITVCVFVFLFLFSATAVVCRNYRLDDYLATKMRLFQTGCLLYCLFLFISTIISFSFIDIPAVICLFIGLRGIVRSDLLDEGRDADEFVKVGGGWWSRPVIGGLCFYVSLAVFIGIIFSYV